LVAEVREYAKVLGLEVEGQYTSYVDWPDDRIVTTLVRTRLGSLDSVPWWFPVVGHLPYKGYFDRERAQAAAEELRAGGEFEVCVSGVTAYSTLGWLDDPVTRPMLLRGAASLVETLFHELVHATAFLPGNADFNEGVAQFIGQQAAIEFFASLPRNEDSELWPTADRVRGGIKDRLLIADSTLDFRARVVELDQDPDRLKHRATAETEARAALAALPLVVIDAERVASNARLSDACLALRGTYVQNLPRHADVYAALGGDLGLMIERLRTFSEDERESEAFFDVESISAP
jgi:predicted aminopeptidase